MTLSESTVCVPVYKVDVGFQSQVSGFEVLTSSYSGVAPC